ncbi:tripartite tricarboxylate transporter TctB family protein [Salinarimonas chemoclinalis]|uniref:tripartite tricarboxylate transporter TctB family protein n=1 Tax=Salinarimonas chemoclinalis TaxID=3241599 RepID=UPI00355726CD
MNAPRLLGIVVAALALGYLLVLVPDLGGDPFSGGGRFYTVGPSALPYLAGGLVLLFSVAVALEAKPATGDADGSGSGSRGLGLGLLFVGLTLAYALGMLLVGFLAASILFLAAVFALYRPRSWVVAGILAIVVPIVVDVILRELFLIPLPSGRLF